MLSKIKNKININKYKRKKCFISHNVELTDSTLCELCNLAHHASVVNCNIGKRTSIGRFSKIRDAEIGSYCSISWDVTIGAVSHPLSRISTHAFSYRKMFGIVNADITYNHEKTFIGNDVWIGCGAIILSGITIGDGAVIGAGAVVTKDVAPYTIVAGIPAKQIKKRFNDETIDELLKIKWWNLSDEIIAKNIDLFSEDLDNKILEKLKEIK